jgi:hypothetical protein
MRGVTFVFAIDGGALFATCRVYPDFGGFVIAMDWVRHASRRSENMIPATLTPPPSHAFYRI